MQFVRRKWGWYITLISRKQFKVKLLRFYKGKSLSLQYHYLRDELWLFLTGFDKGDWRHIKRRQVHTYYATMPTLVLEIQYGEKCKESDIVRI
jgi:hypothetical protein